MTENGGNGESAARPADALDGVVTDGAHRYRVRVYHADADMSGAVYHARYLEWLERGRSDFLRAHGVSHAELKHRSDPQFWVVCRMEIDYLRPARIEEVLEVTTRVCELGKARVVMAQAIARDGRRLVAARVTAAVVDALGRPRRLDRRWAARFAAGLHA